MRFGCPVHTRSGTSYLTARGLSGADARAVIHALLTGLEGAFLLARGLRSTEPFLAIGRVVAGYVTSLPGTANAPHPPLPADRSSRPAREDSGTADLRA
ncbi:hypothetical protein [Amycolatopsis taiwanensis]|uniref:hypothetical protein n=1 Tax=Amycolatopsis taiwanensis TaxID=342230 RepID=UPI000484B9B3|nr:hypothetical protein [Amycolatopsis taiwanensis]